MGKHPPETIVYLSWARRLPWLVVFAGAEAVCVYLLLHLRPVLHLKYLFICAAAVVFPFGLVDSLLDLAGKRPRLRLSLRGLQPRNQPLDDWRDIQDECLTAPHSQASAALLTYRVGDAVRRVDLSECTHDVATLRELLAYYRRHAQHPPGSGRPRQRRATHMP
ncbi:hypothetical protein [Hymenobacter ruricola]|uniref:PH domain-containing protein n=1 Tax=Hymenobacter ruricola TaxID=2791023 RepID=A0ABS0I2U8_9BACT|nr:hypothetical protein [Hymenobacter ruricola]MBF9221276.1 hypothetical protein [Hymenobacter ruricola]